MRFDFQIDQTLSGLLLVEGWGDQKVSVKESEY